MPRVMSLDIAGPKHVSQQEDGGRPPEAQTREARASSCEGGCTKIDPLCEPGWDSLLSTHPQNSFFHSTAWARVLHDSYGHQPVYFCQIADGRLRGLLPVMEVSSTLTGIRGVSLPFTDCCAPLFADERADWDPYSLAIGHGHTRQWRYLECRGSQARWVGASPSLSFHGHRINLGIGEETLFRNLKGCVRRGVRKAAAANLQVRCECSLEAMRNFYFLHCLTRRRHGLPPQPFRFFESIAHHVLASNRGFIISAWLADEPIAASVFFHERQEAFFKFGASNYAFQALRANNLVLWEAIRRYESMGIKHLDLGRTSLSNAGLRRFKRGFGAEEYQINYYKYDLRKRGFVTGFDFSESPVNRVFRWASLPILRWSGAMLYPHLG